MFQSFIGMHIDMPFCAIFASIFFLLLDSTPPVTKSLILNKSLDVELFNKKCGNPNDTFHVEIRYSFNKCLELCLYNPKCEAVNFKRLFNYCELLLKNETTSTEQYGCLFIPRGQISQSEMINCATCTTIASRAHQVNVEDEQSTEQNSTAECTDNQGGSVNSTCSSSGCTPVRSVNHGTVFGNMFNIGSRLFIKCDPGYNITGADPSIICMIDGKWSVLQDCNETSSSTHSSTTTDSTTAVSTLTTTNAPTTSSSLSSTQVTSTTTQQNHQSSSCTSSCNGKPTGNYQSCDTCTGYIACHGGVLYDMSCPPATFWDDDLGTCTYVSTTCP